MATMVIRWAFDCVWHNGCATHMQEMAYQRWRSERIAEEQFFYGPAQLTPRK